MNSERVIPGQVVSEDDDTIPGDDTTPQPQETFLHKVASGPFTPYPSSPSRSNGSAVDDDTEVISPPVADDSADTETDRLATDTPDTGTVGSGTLDTDTADTAAVDAYAPDTDTPDADMADADAPVVEAPVADAVVVEVAETDTTIEDGPDVAAEAEADVPTAGSPVNTVADSDQPLLGEAAGRVREEWRMVQASFVDDPRASVAAAAGVVADAAARLESLLRERQRSLRGSWDGNGQADTETLRQLMLTYRRLLTKLIS
jgi:hypothetical protein